MYFNSFAFCVFYPVVWSLYWLSRFRLQNLLLLAASYLFYSFWDWRFLSLILISTAVDYYVGLKIGRLSGSDDPVANREKKRWLVVSMCTNLGILGFFKYFNFFVESMETLLALTGMEVTQLRLHIILPVGISFYTFQTMSYTIDVYRGILSPTRNFLDFALYVAYFPQLVAGPIERAKNLLPIISSRRTFHGQQLQEGLRLMLFGFFKKVYVADNIAHLVDQIFSHPDPGGWQVLAGTYAFAIQIYCDFSGYTDIARGCSKCLGIDLMLNFRNPYIAVNPSDFWRRWHISLSTWLRDYLYIPLGGNRHGEAKTYRNLALTMLLGGLWHGAAWNFVLWGAWHGLLLIGHRLFAPLVAGRNFLKTQKSLPVGHLLSMVLMFHLVCLGWILFRSGSLAQIQLMLTNLIVWHPTRDAVPIQLFAPIVKFGLPLFMFEIILYALGQKEVRQVLMKPAVVHCAFYGVLFYLIAFYGATAQSFIYFQF